MMLTPEGWGWIDGVGYLPFGGKPVAYDQRYFNKYEGYAQTKQGMILNEMRVAMVGAWITGKIVLDVGIGCGAFVHRMRHLGWACYGTDINPVGLMWLDKHEWLFPEEHRADVLTFWDVLEHIPQPYHIFDHHKSTWVFVAMPIYRDEAHALSSKHFRPGEHCWYFTEAGLRLFMDNYGYECVEMHKKETIIGMREDIWSFAFKRKGWVR